MTNPTVLTQDMWDAWIAALESGNYQQMRHVYTNKILKAEDEAERHCCLDVAAVVWGINRVSDRGTYIASQPIYNLITSSIQADCITANDTAGMSFIEIADMLREYEVVDGYPQKRLSSPVA